MIKPLDLKKENNDNNLQEIQEIKEHFKLHHRNEINKIQMVTNSA